jgi:hypothetical protein
MSKCRLFAFALALLSLTVSSISLAGIEEGKVAFDKNDYKTALQEFKKDRNDPEAMAWIALIYETGQGVKKDPVLAATWMGKAAKGGNTWAQDKFAYYLISGFGIKKDEKQSFQWRTKAADAGLFAAMAPLGRMYRNGIGTPVDTEKALSFFKLGAENGDADAQDQLGFELATGEIATKNYEEARKWLLKSFEAGNHFRSAYLLGLMHANGWGGNIDFAKAFDYYKIAAENEHSSAQNNLGVMFRNGSGVVTDFDQAIYWYKKGAENGSDSAKTNLARLQKYIEDQRIEEQQREARIAAEREQSLNIKRALGTMLCNGKNGSIKEYTGMLVMGQPYYKNIDGKIIVSAYVEKSATPMLMLRVARLQFIYPNRKTTNLQDLDSVWGQLSPGSVFWSDENSWGFCQ